MAKLLLENLVKIGESSVFLADLVLDIGRPIQLCVSPVKLEHLQLITEKIRSALNVEPEMASHQSARQAPVTYGIVIPIVVE
jgi:hypothetical protein